MACDICGRDSCTRSFHSIAAQEAHDNPPDYEARCAALEQQLAEANAALQALRDKYEPDNSKYAQAMRQAVNEPKAGEGRHESWI